MKKVAELKKVAEDPTPVEEKVAEEEVEEEHDEHVE